MFFAVFAAGCATTTAAVAACRALCAAVVPALIARVIDILLAFVAARELVAALAKAIECEELFEAGFERVFFFHGFGQHDRKRVLEERPIPVADQFDRAERIQRLGGGHAHFGGTQCFDKRAESSLHAVPLLVINGLAMGR